MQQMTKNEQNRRQIAAQRSWPHLEEANDEEIVKESNENLLQDEKIRDK